MPKAISGFLSNLNTGSLEWGWNGFLAFGCHSLVVVYHAETMNLVQTLAGHSGCVVKVRWYKESTPRDSSLIDSYDWFLRVASADSDGKIIVWDVLRGICKCSFGETSSPVVDMQWLRWQDASSDLLVVLHQPATLTLWNADQGTKLWKTLHTDPLVAMALDPLHYQRVAFLNSSGNLILLNDFSVSNVPNAFGRQYKILPTDSTQPQADCSDVATRKSNMTLSIRSQLVKAFAAAGGVSSTSTAKSAYGDDCSFEEHRTDDVCRQIVFHSSTRNHLFLVYPRDIALVNVVRMQTVVCLTFDRSASPIVTLWPCRSRDAFYLFQENGLISLRIKKYQSMQIDFLNPLTIGYETVCHIDQPRPAAKCLKVFSASVEPHMESSVAIVGNNGRISRYALQSELPKDEPLLPRLDDFVLLNRDMSQTVPSPLRFSLEATTSGIGASVSILRMCPAFDGTKHQLVAVGHLDGLVQLVDLRSCEVRREFSIHSCPVRCLEWSSPEHIVSSGCSQSFSSSTIVRNEVLFTDVRNGSVRVLRPEQDESPIEMLRVSHFCCYLAIAFRRQPLEVWDLRSFRLLRKMSRRCPIVVDMSWSTKHHQVERLVPEGKLDKAAENAAADNSATSKAGRAGRELYRENLVVLDFENHLWHIVVKGMHVRDGREVKTQWITGGSVSAMAWKQDILVFGDSDGRVSFWDLESKVSKFHLTKLGAVKRVRFCTFPEDFTAVALHADGISLWNVQNLVRLSQCSFSEMNVRCLDADLSEDACPVVLTADGCVRLFDIHFSTVTSGVEDSLMSTLFCPMLCSRSGAMLIRQLLLNLYRLARVHEPVKQDFRLYEHLLDRLVEAVRLSSLEEHDRVHVVKQLHCIGESRLVAIAKCSNVVERNLLVASLFGDDWATCFWAVFKGVTSDNQGGHPISFPSFFDYLLPNELFRISERLHSATVDFRQCSADQLQHHVTTLTLLGEYDTVIQMLIEADNSRPSYFSDSLKACLLASDRSSPECQSTIKLVATNLIAGGKLTDGVQLLRSIDKSLDACRYLQSFGFWEESVWLAKVTLDSEACTGVLLKWADHLGSTEACQKSLALLVLLSLAQWPKVLEVLLTMKQIPTAASFVEALRAYPDAAPLNSIPSTLITVVDSENLFYYKLCDSLRPEASPIDSL
uniref:WD repeat-containing protein 11 n=1 Tax=Trichuris muris TaxID=70415 RepID=A0A5S6QSA6_TRIMR